MIKKKAQRFKKEYIKKKYHIQREFEKIFLKTIMYSHSIRVSKKLLAYSKKTKKKNKRKSVSYQTTLCMETGHYKSRINWGKISRFSFKSSANKNTFASLIKKTK